MKLIASRKFIFLTTNSRIRIKADKSLSTDLIITVTFKGGTLEFRLFDSSEQEVFSLVNPATGEYRFTMSPSGVYHLSIKARSAIGSYKVQSTPRK